MAGNSSLIADARQHEISLALLFLFDFSAAWNSIAG
jgi:hypothetical protein